MLCVELDAQGLHYRLGEVCLHVAAILFKAEACIRLGIASETCTSQPCLWNQAYSKKVQSCAVSSISLQYILLL